MHIAQLYWIINWINHYILIYYIFIFKYKIFWKMYKKIDKESIKIYKVKCFMSEKHMIISLYENKHLIFNLIAIHRLIYWQNKQCNFCSSKYLTFKDLKINDHLLINDYLLTSQWFV